MKNHKKILMSLVFGLLAAVSFWAADVKADSLTNGSDGYYSYSNGYQYYVLNDGSYYYLQNGQWIYVAAETPVVEEAAEEEVTEADNTVAEENGELRQTRPPFTDEDEEEADDKAADKADKEPTMEDIYNCWCWPIIGRRHNPADVPTFPKF